LFSQAREKSMFTQWNKELTTAPKGFIKGGNYAQRKANQFKTGSRSYTETCRRLLQMADLFGVTVDYLLKDAEA
jgi:hypothetical protein